MHYTRIEGKRAAKLQTLEALQSLDDLSFDECPSAWEAPFRPAGIGDYFEWPLLTDLMPWQTSGVQVKRTWPLAAEPEVLNRRWKGLLNSPNRAAAFKETRDRKIDKSLPGHLGDDLLQSISALGGDAAAPAVCSYGYRSFDRHHLLADNRLADYLRPALWVNHSSAQLYFASLLTKPLGSGQALTISGEVPDMDYFSGRGAKDVLPLWRDAEATKPNLHSALLALLRKQLGVAVTPEDFAAYLYAVLAQPAFTARFHDELETRELRVPLTTDADLFARAVALGGELLFLHSYGERFASGRQWPAPLVKNIKAVSGSALPETFAYDPDRQVITVSDGQFGPVSKAVWDYEVSGLKVVQSWLGYRMRKRKGKKSSPLDEITPASWGSEYTSEFLRLLNLLTRTLELHPQQEQLLDEIVAGTTVQADALGPVPPQWRKAPKVKAAQGGLEV